VHRGAIEAEASAARLAALHASPAPLQTALHTPPGFFAPLARTSLLGGVRRRRHLHQPLRDEPWAGGASPRCVQSTRAATSAHAAASASPRQPAQAAATPGR